MQPPSSKRASRSKTSDLNSVVISHSLNSTFIRMVDVIQRSLDVIAPTGSALTPSIVTFFIKSQTAPFSSISSQSLGPLSNPLSASASTTEILDQLIRIILANDSLLSEDELLAASLFFTSASEDAICAAQSFIALSNQSVVQYHFLHCQLEMAALFPGKDKAKAMDTEDNDDSRLLMKMRILELDYVICHMVSRLTNLVMLWSQS